VPPPEPARYPADQGDRLYTHPQLAVGEQAVRDNFVQYGLLDAQVRFLPGWFKDTLDTPEIERLAILRVDGDLYQSTIESLTTLYPKLSRGGYVIIDDFSIIPACAQAVIAFRKQHAIDTPMIPIDRCGVYWIKD
jgi:O-methyltransferase